MTTSLAHLAAKTYTDGRLFTRFESRERTDNAIIYTFADASQLVIPKKHGWQMPVVVTQAPIQKAS